MTDRQHILAEKLQGAIFKWLERKENEIPGGRYSWAIAAQNLVMAFSMEPDEAADYALEYISRRDYMIAIGVR